MSPKLIIADSTDRTRGQLDVDNVEAKHMVESPEPHREALNLVVKLFRQTEDVPVVLCELAQSKQPV
jgi:hypothetical protein